MIRHAVLKGANAEKNGRKRRDNGQQRASALSFSPSARLNSSTVKRAGANQKKNIVKKDIIRNAPPKTIPLKQIIATVKTAGNDAGNEQDPSDERRFRRRVGFGFTAGRAAEDASLFSPRPRRASRRVRNGLRARTCSPFCPSPLLPRVPPP